MTRLAIGAPDASEIIPGLLCDQASNHLRTHLVGQSHVIEPIVDALLIAEADMTPPERCAGGFLLMGPTGVGKTLTVELIAEALHGDQKKMIRVNCEEFAHSHEVARLIGAPPGYLGHRETVGVLDNRNLVNVTSAQCKFSVVLFDEIEKAHEDFHRMLLGILDGPTLTSGANIVTNFHKSLIFMTSNLGSRGYAERMDSAFALPGVDTTARETPETIYHRAAKKFFSPEFMGRLDGQFVYHPLSGANFQRLLQLEVAKLEARSPMLIEVSEAATKSLVLLADMARYGGREVRRVVQERIGRPLARFVATGHSAVKAQVYADASKGVQVRFIEAAAI